MLGLLGCAAGDAARRLRKALRGEESGLLLGEGEATVAVAAREHLVLRLLVLGLLRRHF